MPGADASGTGWGSARANVARSQRGRAYWWLDEADAVREVRERASVTCYGVNSSAVATGSLPHPLGEQFASLVPPELIT